MSILYTGSSAVTIANTTTETTMLPDAVTIPADFIGEPDTLLRVTSRGIYGTDAVVAPTLRIRVKVGGLAVYDSSAQTVPLAGATSEFLDLNVLIAFRVVGASGSVIGSGRADLTLARVITILANQSTQSVNTTASNALDVTAQWGTADADNSLLVRMSVVEVLPAS